MVVECVIVVYASCACVCVQRQCHVADVESWTHRRGGTWFTASQLSLQFPAVLWVSVNISRRNYATLPHAQEPMTSSKGRTSDSKGPLLTIQPQQRVLFISGDDDPVGHPSLLRTVAPQLPAQDVRLATVPVSVPCSSAWTYCTMLQQQLIADVLANEPHRGAYAVP